jgi:RNA polymerase sigma-B factor
MEPGGPQESEAQGRKGAGSHSGRLLLRMPESLHADLARASEQAGVSLNGYINEALANAVGRRPAARPAPAGDDARRDRRRFAERLLLVNLVVVAAVGALVIVLLVQALR